jgi:hypothetical protein
MTKQSASSKKDKASRKLSYNKLFRPSRLPTFLPFMTGPATLCGELSTKFLSISKMSMVVSHRSCMKIAADNELRSMVYNTQLPIDIVFNAVEDYVDFADLANQL